MNIKALADETKQDNEVHDLPIKQRDGSFYLGADGKRATLAIVGEYSKQFRANERAVTNKRLKDSRSDDEVDAEELERRLAERIACGVVSWNGWDSDGAAVPFSQGAVVELFLAAPWIAEQAAKAVREHARFFSARSTGS